MLIFKEIVFEAAHLLPNVPEGHKCARLHGHSYVLRIYISGEIDSKAGWVMDFADMNELAKPFIEQLDHHYLNEIAGLENPTCENLTRWLWKKLAAPIPGLNRLVVMETPTSGCDYRGEDE